MQYQSTFLIYFAAVVFLAQCDTTTTTTTKQGDITDDKTTKGQLSDEERLEVLQTLLSKYEKRLEAEQRILANIENGIQNLTESEGGVDIITNMTDVVIDPNDELLMNKLMNGTVAPEVEDQKSQEVTKKAGKRVDASTKSNKPLGKLAPSYTALISLGVLALLVILLIVVIVRRRNVNRRALRYIRSNTQTNAISQMSAVTGQAEECNSGAEQNQQATKQPETSA